MKQIFGIPLDTPTVTVIVLCALVLTIVLSTTTEAIIGFFVEACQ